MSNTLQGRAMPLFVEAIDLPESQREAFVQSACVGDEALMGEVRSLLASHENAGAFLSDATAGPLPEETASDPVREAPGGQIGPYKLLQRIGEGGFGAVFLAEQERPVRRKVALKVIKPGMDTRQVITRFEAERQALAMMDHAHIAKVLDAGATETGRPYFVMELVRGVPITDYCDTNNLPLPERLELFVQVCQAVQHAHSKGIIHRDLKPSNVMVTMADGRPSPKIIDFGIAKATEQRLTEKTVFTEFRQMIGTPQYMSPEQAEMAGIDIDTRSDVYSLGVLLYELLVGSTPFDPKELRSKAYGEMRRMIREVEPPRPSTRLDTLGDGLRPIAARRRIEPVALTHALRGELDWIVMRAMEKDRTRRYETADGLARDVQRYLADEPVEACPPSLSYRAGKILRKNRLVITTCVAVCAALLVGTGISAWQAFRATRAFGLAKTRLEAQTIAQDATRAQLGLTKKAQAEALLQLFEARLAQVRAGHLSRRVGQRLASLEALAEANRIARDLKLPEERLLQLRNEAIACFALPDLRLGRPWPGFPPGTVRLDFDGALERYARVDRSGAISIRRVAGDVEIARLPSRSEGGANVYTRFSDDGSYLAVAGPGDFTVWKIDGEKPSVACQIPGGGYGGAFSADSRQVAFCQADGSLKVYDLASGRDPRKIASGQLAWCMAFDPRGRILASSSNNSVVLRDLDNTTVVATLEQPGAPSCIAWHPDGNRLAVACDDHHVYLWDVRLGKQTAVLDGLRNKGVKVAFNHSGDLLATNGWENVLRLWDVRTNRLLFSTVSGGAIEMPRFSSDDTQLADDIREGGNIAMWQIITGRGEYRSFTHTGTIVYQTPAIHRDGRLLAVGTQNGVALWDMASGLDIGFVSLPGCNHILFEPSGALLTNSSSGLWRWPVNPDPARRGCCESARRSACRSPVPCATSPAATKDG
ncbi:MAG: pknB [Phycisphaerales bacterium]|nr:pknB [Phycisphaerales bacterium]